MQRSRSRLAAMLLASLLALAATVVAPTAGVCEQALKAKVGVLRLSSTIRTTDVSATTPASLAARPADARRMRPWNGDSGARASQSQTAAGIFRAASRAGRAVDTSGSNSVISPRGRGRVLFTRRNWCG